MILCRLQISIAIVICHYIECQNVHTVYDSVDTYKLPVLNNSLMSLYAPRRGMGCCQA